jgi:hypothetical protein
MTNPKEENCFIFHEAVCAVAAAYGKAMCLQGVKSLADEQRTATITLSRGCLAFLRGIRSEFGDAMPQIDANNVMPHTGDEKGFSRKPGEYRETLDALDDVVFTVHRLLSRPNRLNQEQRALAYDVIDVAADFASVDFMTPSAAPTRSVAAKWSENASSVGPQPSAS